MPKIKFHENLPTESIIDNWDADRCKSWLLKSEQKINQLPNSEKSANARLAIALRLRREVPPLQIAVKTRLEVLTGGITELSADSMRALLKAGKLKEEVILQLAKSIASAARKS